MKHFTLDTLLSLKDLENQEFISQFKGKKLYGLIGNPVSKSISHITHNQVFEKLNFPGIFFRIHLEEVELSQALDLLHIIGFEVVAVTMPFKEKVLPFLLIQPVEGSVNTLIRNKEGFTGINTDALAIEKLLSNYFNPSISASILGAGGTAKAAAYILHKHRIPFTFYNRSLDKGRKLAYLFNTSCKALEDFYCPKSAHIIINTTSVGMEPDIDKCPIKLEKIEKNAIIFDAIYRPYKTQLIEYAEKLNLQVILGFDMFTMQAMFQLKLMLGICFDEKEFFAIFSACQTNKFSHYSAL